MGLSEVDIHRMIPDRPKTSRRTAEAAVGAVPEDSVTEETSPFAVVWPEEAALPTDDDTGEDVDADPAVAAK